MDKKFLSKEGLSLLIKTVKDFVESKLRSINRTQELVNTSIKSLQSRMYAYQLKDLESTPNNVALFDDRGNSVDSGYAIGGNTLSSSGKFLATEEAVKKSNKELLKEVEVISKEISDKLDIITGNSGEVVFFGADGKLASSGLKIATEEFLSFQHVVELVGTGDYGSEANKVYGYIVNPDLIGNGEDVFLDIYCEVVIGLILHSYPWLLQFNDGTLVTGVTPGDIVGRKYTGLPNHIVTESSFINYLDKALSELLEKDADAVENNVATFDANGQVKDSGVKAGGAQFVEETYTGLKLTGIVSGAPDYYTTVQSGITVPIGTTVYSDATCTIPVGTVTEDKTNNKYTVTLNNGGYNVAVFSKPYSKPSDKTLATEAGVVDYVETKVATLENSVENNMERLNKIITTQSEYTGESISMSPFTRYIIQEPGVVDISFNSDGYDANQVLEYIMQFTATSSTSLVFNSAVQWAGGNAPQFIAGKTYEISIVNNLAVYIEF